MQKIANAAVPGYAAFGLALWLQGMPAAGWFDADGAALAALLGVVLGGGVLVLAGLLQALRGQLLDSSLFLVFGGFWWLALLVQRAAASGHPPSPGLAGWCAFLWALVAFSLWLAARTDGTARTLFNLSLGLALLAAALAHWLDMGALDLLAGYLELIAGTLGLYIAAAELINTTHGHTVLPLGEPAPPAPRSTGS